MRQRLVVAATFILLCTLQAWPAASQQTGPKKRIAVAKFDTIGSFSAEYGTWDIGGGLAAQLTTALRAAESRRGLPYVWGAAGPSSFDCSGLVEWSFAQAGISMPRVAADQARTGLSVPVTRLQPGDLLFYHTDPTDPGYISHVAIYLGSGWMIQAPQPGMNVEIVPARFGSQFAGAVRVYPRTAATLASGLA